MGVESLGISWHSHLNNPNMEQGAIMKKLLIAVVATSAIGCATLTSDPMTPVAFSFSDGSNGKCTLTNKRGIWQTEIPVTIYIRRSDDALKYQCETEGGQSATGMIPSTVGAKIIASAVFLDFGITDAITDKHREYPASFVIPVLKWATFWGRGLSPFMASHFKTLENFS